jgi:hypothetical protein
LQPCDCLLQADISCRHATASPRFIILASGQVDFVPHYLAHIRLSTLAAALLPNPIAYLFETSLSTSSGTSVQISRVQGQPPVPFCVYTRHVLLQRAWAELGNTPTFTSIQSACASALLALVFPNPSQPFRCFDSKFLSLLLRLCAKTVLYRDLHWSLGSCGSREQLHPKRTNSRICRRLGV